jgi:hypothetical protein
MEGGDRELSDTAGLWMKEEKECIALLSRNIKRFRSRLGMSQIELALLAKTLKVGFPFPFQGLENDSAQARHEQLPFRVMFWRTEGHSFSNRSRKLLMQYCASGLK